jgi:hypothetical protein
MSTPCRGGETVAPLYDDRTAYCPHCGWEDKGALKKSEDEAYIRPHKPLSGVIVQGKDESGRRDFLDEKPLNCGIALQIAWWTGTQRAWLPCRYERDPYNSRPLLFVALPSSTGREVSAAIIYTRDLGLRWPPAEQSDVLRRYIDVLACSSCGSRRKDCGCAARRDSSRGEA